MGCKIGLETVFRVVVPTMQVVETGVTFPCAKGTFFPDPDVLRVAVFEPSVTPVRVGAIRHGL